MSQIEPTTTTSISSRYCWLIWAALLILWTIGLLLPVSADISWDNRSLGISLKLIAAKLLHFGAYTVLAVLASCLRVVPRYRWLLVFFLMFHATATEALQTLIPGRGGSLRDVLFDQVGIALGILVSWRIWTAPDRKDHSSPN